MLHPHPTIVLMGLRGSGKTTVARLVAARLGRESVDLDDRVAALAGMPIAALIRDRGEAAFRDAEVVALRAALAQAATTPIVLALGGGTPTATPLPPLPPLLPATGPSAADLLRDAQRAGKIRLIYLRADPATLASRLRAAAEHDPAAHAHRPSLTGRPIDEEIAEQFAARDGLYTSLAGTVVEVAGLSAEAVAGRVAESEPRR